MNSKRLPAPTRDIDTLKSELSRFGYCMIEDALPRELLARHKLRLDEQQACESQNLERNPANDQPLNRWIGMLLNKGDVFFEVVQTEIVDVLNTYMLGSDFQISCVDAHVQLPGSLAMPLHSDQWWVPPLVTPGGDHVRAGNMTREMGSSQIPTQSEAPISAPLVTNVMWMITDFTKENGATHLVPGSHLSGASPDPTVPYKMDTVQAEGEAGTAFVFDGRLWHGGGANQSSSPRVGLVTNYCAPFCRPIENYTRGMKPEVLKRCPPGIVRRLGFQTWNAYGHTGELDTNFAKDAIDCLGELHP